MNLTKGDLALIKQGLLELDKLGKFGRTPSDLLHKLEQELGDEQTSLRKQNLKKYEGVNEGGIIGTKK